MPVRTAAVAASLALVALAGMTAAVVGVEDDTPTNRVLSEAAIAPASPIPLPKLAATAARDVPDAAQPEPPTQATPTTAVAPLRVIYTPDILVTAPRPLTGAQVADLAALDDLEGLAIFRTADVTIGGTQVQVAGVDPSQFRSFTPQETATSNRLWQAVADGELVASYALGRDNPLALGGPVTVQGATTASLKLGARAALGVPGIDALTDRTALAALGRNGGAALISASQRGIESLERAVRDALGQDVEITILRIKPVPGVGRPSNYLELYMRSARLCPGMSWTLLAAIGQIESGHGVNLGPSSAGALGPMQFLPSTWAYYRVDGDGDGAADIMSPFDAVPAAALYLCRNGAGNGGDDLYNAVFAYNHSDSYVRKVLALADRYG